MNFNYNNLKTITNKTIYYFFEKHIRSRLPNLISILMPFLAFFIVLYFLPTQPTVLTLLPFYVISILLIIYNPIFVLILLFVLTSTIFSLETFPQAIAIGKIGLYLPEALVVLLLVRTMLIAAVKKDFHRMSSPLSTPVIILCLWILFSIFNALLSQRATLIEAILTSRGYIYYLNFFLVLYYLDSEEKIKFMINGLLIIAFICAILSFVQYVVGPEYRIFPGDAWAITRVLSAGEESTLARVMPASISLIYMFFFPVLVGVINGGLKNNRWYKLFIILAIISMFVSFTRNIYYSVILGVFLIWMTFKGKVRRNITRNIITVSLLALLVTYLPVFFGIIRVPNWWEQIFSRPAEVLRAGSETQTLAWRTIESRAIMNAIVKSPVLGNGIGATYYHPWYGLDASFAHNGYMSIIFQIGFVGLAIFLMIFIYYVFLSIKVYRAVSNNYYRSIILGFLVAFVALLPAVWVKSVLVVEHHWISLIGFIWAFPTIISRIGDGK